MKKLMNLKVLTLVLIIGITCTSGMFLFQNDLPAELPTPMPSTNPSIDTDTIITDIIDVKPGDTASAATTAPELQPCHNCKMKLLSSTISYGSWVRLGNQRLCTDNYAFGVDLEVQRTATLTESCDNCDFSLTTESTERRWECNGFNKNPLL